MPIDNVFAYAVAPQKNTNDPATPEGGSVPVSAELRTVLTESNEAAQFHRKTEIAFEVDTATRTNEVRDWVMTLAFGTPREAAAVSLDLARRLSTAMDQRSTPALFICSTYDVSDGNRKRVTLWTFPRDAAFQFSHGDGRQRVRVLRDVFSQTSGLRKAAMFEGRQLRNHFLTGRALDYQAGGTTRDIAEFWIKRFLMCRFGLRGDAGTRLLARALKDAFDHCPDPHDKEQLYATIMALRVAPARQHSIENIAETYLSGRAKAALLEALPDEGNAGLLFEVQPDVLEATLNFRVFELVSGVVVSSPFGEIGTSVILSEGEAKHLTCSGDVRIERLRKRHA